MWGWLPLLCEKRRQTAEKAGEALPLASICSSLMGHQDSGGTGLEPLASSSSLIYTNLSREEDPLKVPQCLKDAETLSTLLPCSRVNFHRASATAPSPTSGSGLSFPKSTRLNGRSTGPAWVKLLSCYQSATSQAVHRVSRNRP